MPAALISSSANCAPMRPCWPEYDIAPDVGCRMPTLMGAPCARSTAGAASAAAPSAVEVRKRRRFNDDMLFSPRIIQASLTLVLRALPQPQDASATLLDLAQLRVIGHDVEPHHDAGKLRRGRWIELHHQR